MITPSDKGFAEAKRVLQGIDKLPPEMQELADWIGQTYGVKPVNILYEEAGDTQTPRLDICLEHAEDKQPFIDGNSWTYNKEKQQAIAAKFREIVAALPPPPAPGFLDALFGKKVATYKTDGVWVVFSTFEPVARMDANESISEGTIEAFRQSLRDPNLWTISRMFAAVTFFLYTDEQVNAYKNSPVVQEWTDKYYELLRQFDEFGYVKREDFQIYIDSKENFDNNFGSNWWYYYK